MTREQDTNSGGQDPAAPSLSAAPKQVVVNNGFDKLFVVFAVGSRHLEIKSCFKCFCSVAYGTPVTYDIAFKSPFVS